MRRLWWLATLPWLACSLLVFEANGLTPTSLASLLIPALFATLALGRRRLTIAILTIGLIFIASRFAPTPPNAVQTCTTTTGPLTCDSGATRWQRVIDEREATRAGLSLSGHLGMMRGREFDTFDALLDSSWASLPGAWRGGPNALLLTSTVTHVEALRFRSPREGKRPAIIFLHGFGGLLTLYVEAIARGTHGDFDVIAPALDPLGAWWTPRGQAVITRTLDALPDDVDRTQVYLVGLSNGGIGASATLAHPAVAKRFAGVVLLSGVGELDELTHPPPTRVLLISGTRDVRFRGEWVSSQFDALTALGADVTWRRFDADHFLLLTHATEWTSAFEAWRRSAHEPTARRGSSP
ncbi:MAG: hypothetical protein U0228_31945 [Myxococcaceae bacterium]